MVQWAGGWGKVTSEMRLWRVTEIFMSDFGPEGGQGCRELVLTSSVTLGPYQRSVSLAMQCCTG